MSNYKLAIMIWIEDDKFKTTLTKLLFTLLNYRCWYSYFTTWDKKKSKFGLIISPPTASRQSSVSWWASRQPKQFFNLIDHEIIFGQTLTWIKWKTRVQAEPKELMVRKRHIRAKNNQFKWKHNLPRIYVEAPKNGSQT